MPTAMRQIAACQDRAELTETVSFYVLMLLTFLLN